MEGRSLSMIQDLFPLKQPATWEVAIIRIKDQDPGKKLARPLSNQ
jgi:hypothetical protein